MTAMWQQAVKKHTHPRGLHAPLPWPGLQVEAFFEYYPRRVAQVLFVDAPWVFYPAWEVIKPAMRKYAALVSSAAVCRARMQLQAGAHAAHAGQLCHVCPQHGMLTPAARALPACWLLRLWPSLCCLAPPALLCAGALPHRARAGKGVFHACNRAHGL